MDTIRRLCDRCVVLSHGKILYDGETEKAIAVYMTQSLGEDGVDMDLRDRTRDVVVRDAAFQMSHLRLTDKAAPVYAPEETLRFRLTVRAEMPVDAAVRLTLRTDADVGLGSAWSPRFPISAGTHELMLTMPLNALAKGVFYASIGVYRFDEIGRPVPLDHITRAFKIELTGSPTWNVPAHGYMRLPEIEIESDAATTVPPRG